MNEDNPFAVSETCSGQVAVAVDGSDPHAFRVVGDLLVCGPSVILPPVCLETGETEDLVSVSQQTQFHSFRLVIRQRNCHVVYWLARHVQRRKRLRKASGILVQLLGIGLVVAGIAGLEAARGITLLAGIIVVAVATFVASRSAPTLYLQQYARPDTYWIRGFPKDYLARIAGRETRDDSATADRRRDTSEP
ncbi:MAG: hypothetical protein RIK87_05175 [Fuerstiella sp.]